MAQSNGRAQGPNTKPLCSYVYGDTAPLKCLFSDKAAYSINMMSSTETDADHLSAL